MKPVHLLSTEEATQELEQLLDAKPTEDPIALHHWNQAHAPRAAELQTWLLMHPQDAPTQQIQLQEPAVIETPTPTPQEQLAALLVQLAAATQDCTSAADRGGYLKARSRVYQHRAAINRLVATAGLEPPSLPVIPANPYAWQAETDTAPAADLGSTSEPGMETETGESEDSELGALAAQHGEALRGLGELMQQYPGEIDADLGMRLGFLLDILGNSLCLAGEGVA